MVVQIAKHIVGCSKVIGLAGSDEKCRWVESLGADTCINYKDADWKDQLTNATPGFVDVYFDNVGGEQLDFMLGRMKMYGRIAACGAISMYNQRNFEGIKNWVQIILQRLEVSSITDTSITVYPPPSSYQVTMRCRHIYELRSHCTEVFKFQSRLITVLSRRSEDSSSLISFREPRTQ